MLTKSIAIIQETMVSCIFEILKELINAPASSSCPICHKTYRQIAQRHGDFTPKEVTVNYGFSILHFGIRAFKTIYKIDSKQDI